MATADPSEYVDILTCFEGSSEDVLRDQLLARLSR
jgi:hypothetical protein